MNTLKVMALQTQPFVLFQIATNEFRPALVVNAWSNQSANLLVFADGSNDGLKVDYTMNTGDCREAQNGLNNGKFAGVWRTSVCHGTGVGQWLHPWEVEVDETGLCYPCHQAGQICESYAEPLKPFPEESMSGCTSAPTAPCTGCDPSGTSCGSQAAGSIKTE